MLLPEKTIFHKYWLFCYRFFAFTFDLCGLLSVICKQLLKQCNFSVDQSALLTGFRTDSVSSVWNFCRWVADIPPCDMSLAAKSEEKRMFSQAIATDHRDKSSFVRGTSFAWQVRSTNFFMASCYWARSQSGDSFGAVAEGKTHPGIRSTLAAPCSWFCFRWSPSPESSRKSPRPEKSERSIGPMNSHREVHKGSSFWTIFSIRLLV